MRDLYLGNDYDAAEGQEEHKPTEDDNQPEAISIEEESTKLELERHTKWLVSTEKSTVDVLTRPLSKVPKLMSIVHHHVNSPNNSTPQEMTKVGDSKKGSCDFKKIQISTKYSMDAWYTAEEESIVIVHFGPRDDHITDVDNETVAEEENDLVYIM